MKSNPSRNSSVQPATIQYTLVIGFVVEVDNVTVFHHVPKVKRTSKLDMKTDPGLFLGYAKTSLGYRILDLCTGKLIERRDAIFKETITADPTFAHDLIDKVYFGKNVDLPSAINFVPLPVSRVLEPVEAEQEFCDESGMEAEEIEVEDEEFFDAADGTPSESDESTSGSDESSDESMMTKTLPMQ
ncbi:hypothetical protein PPTG_21141 [Phytophthora nicotianae INRA-310]|uniref:Retroviral polymerase SH3-like domain-containing protein n=1 Tax=Phytophthora nicotianae (strain INRA-310) TaxID=761204 RepID=W2R8R2_PHYN3|nr:hypothetical protein PPTG_21141 [Phytophthora nicotianae INRA-310]ETN21778.1 hypothetical protein PPTG_21141 [Phytophthora nicotianae INRA-310]